MPQGPAGGPRPLADAFQTLEFGVFGDISADEAERAGNKLQEIFGTEKVGTQTTDEMEGGVLAVPLQTDTVYVDDIEQFLEEKEAETIADNLWTVRAYVEGKMSAIRPFAEAKQKFIIRWNFIPEEALKYEKLAEESIEKDIITRQGSKFEEEDITEVEVDYSVPEVAVTVDTNSIGGNARLDIKGANYDLPREVSGEIWKDVLGDVPSDMDTEQFQLDEFDRLQDAFNRTEITQEIIRTI